MESWLTAIRDIKYYQDIYGSFDPKNDKIKFLQRLQDKLSTMAKEKDLIKDQFSGQVTELQMDQKL